MFDDAEEYQNDIREDFKPFARTKKSVPDTASMKRAACDAEKTDGKNLKAGGPFLAEKKVKGKRPSGHFWFKPATMEAYFE